MTDSVAATMSRVRSRDDMSKVAEKDVISSSPHDKDKAATGGGAVLHSHNDAAHVVPLKVRVLLGPEDSNHQFYEIRLTLPHGKSWSVNRRYSEFLVLFHELEHMQGEEEKKAFPPRHPFASSTNTSVVHESKLQLATRLTSAHYTTIHVLSYAHAYYTLFPPRTHTGVEKLPAWLCAISQNQTLSTQPQFRAFLGLDKIEPLLEAEVKTLTGGENSGPLLPLESTTVMPGEGHVGPASPHTPPLKAAAASEVSQPQSPNTNGMRFRDIMPAIPRAPVVRPHHHITTEAKQQQQHAAEDMAHAEVTVALPSFVSLNAKSELDSARQLEERAKSLSSVARREATEATALLARADKEKAAREEIKANLKRIRGDAELGTKSEKELLLAAAALDQQQTYVREKASRIEAKVADLNREASELYILAHIACTHILCPLCGYTNIVCEHAHKKRLNVHLSILAIAIVIQCACIYIGNTLSRSQARRPQRLSSWGKWRRRSSSVHAKSELAPRSIVSRHVCLSIRARA